MTPHPYLTPDQFDDNTFLRVRRQVALMLLPYATGRGRRQLEQLIALYDDLLAGR